MGLSNDGIPRTAGTAARPWAGPTRGGGNGASGARGGLHMGGPYQRRRGGKSGRPGAGASGRRFSIGVSGLYACELEVDGEGVPHVHRLAVHFAGDEFGETLNHTHCFFVEIGVFSAEDFHFAD